MGGFFWEGSGFWEGLWEGSSGRVLGSGRIRRILGSCIVSGGILGGFWHSSGRVLGRVLGSGTVLDPS